MTKAEAIDLIDTHKNKLIDLDEMLSWTWLRVIVLNVSEQDWEQALDRASEKPPESTTVEQRAWQVVHEYGPRWHNEYSRKYPSSTLSAPERARLMAHYCVVAALGGDPHV